MFPVQVQNYMRQDEIFADAFNYFVYGGEQVINPETLEELDTREIDVPYGGEKGEKQPVQKKRYWMQTNLSAIWGEKKWMY